jgi:hypothetical protein
MSFKKNLTDIDKQKIVNILKAGYSEKERAKRIIELFPKDFEDYSKWFDYEKFCNTEYEKRYKYNFLPTKNIDYMTFGDTTQNKTAITFVITLNSILIGIVKLKSTKVQDDEN